MSFLQQLLIIDNNRDDAHFTTFALQRVGVITPVVTVADGEQAVSYLTARGSDPGDGEGLPALLLLELGLPGKSGLELLAWLRGQPVLKRLPVIVLTASSDPEDVNRAYELGCNSYLVKPPSFNTLLVMMQGVVQYWLQLNRHPRLARAGGGGFADF